MANTRWLIKDGPSVAIMGDAWLGDLPLCYWPTMICTEMVDSMQVCNLLTGEGGIVFRLAICSGSTLQRRFVP